MEYLDKTKNSAVYAALAMSTVKTTWNARGDLQVRSGDSRLCVSERIAKIFVVFVFVVQGRLIT